MKPVHPSGPSASVVIPAHNEQRAIGRLLNTLLADSRVGEYEIVVVCNGCTDQTASAARAAAPEATVLEIPLPSKQAALRLGDATASATPRVYIDADVELTTGDLRALLAGLDDEAVLAAAPVREVDRRGIAWPVRWFYDVWEQLPHVQSGLFGRGVIALSRQGLERVQRLPPVMSDDLAMSEAFSDNERSIVQDSLVLIHPPRSTRDLFRRRVRVATGNAQLDRMASRSPGASTDVRTLLQMVRAQPRLLSRVCLFVGVGLAARLSASRRIRRGDFTTWERDESSRLAP